jgi:hypothetical protein
VRAASGENEQAFDWSRCGNTIGGDVRLADGLCMTFEEKFQLILGAFALVSLYFTPKTQ